MPHIFQLPTVNIIYSQRISCRACHRRTTPLFGACSPNHNEPIPLINTQASGNITSHNVVSKPFSSASGVLQPSEFAFQVANPKQEQLENTPARLQANHDQPPLAAYLLCFSYPYHCWQF